MKAYPIKTRYIKPGENFIPIVIESLKNSNIKLKDGDFVVLSEKMVSTSENNFVDEKDVKPKFWAYLTYYWSKYFWGYILGPLLGTRKDRVKNLRKMPKKETLRHKQVVINHVGLIYALKPASEGGVDLTNVPGSYASLLPKEPKKWAEKLHRKIKEEFGVDVVVMVVDTDATYRFFNWYFTALPYAIDGIISRIGVLGYVIGKIGKRLGVGGLVGATPLAIAGNEIYKKYPLEKILKIADLADNSHITTKSIHDVMKRYNTFEITVEVLEELEHTPVVVVKVDW
jgi:F420-0:gamma-glutamyl ligase-like protein